MASFFRMLPGQMLAAPAAAAGSDSDSFPSAYFYTQPGATGPGMYDNMAPQSWQDGGAVTGDLFNPHQQTFDQPGNAIGQRRMLWQV